MNSAPTPKTGPTSQEVDERNPLPEQGGGGSHGLKGRPGNNQTKKGRNLRYVIQAKQFRERLVRGADSGTSAQVTTTSENGIITGITVSYPPPLSHHP